MNLKAKVLDFVKFGGPRWTVDRTIFEMRLGCLYDTPEPRTPKNIAGLKGVEA